MYFLKHLGDKQRLGDNQLISGIQGGVDATPSHKVSWEFYQEQFLSEHALFSSLYAYP